MVACEVGEGYSTFSGEVPMENRAFREPGRSRSRGVIDGWVDKGRISLYEQVCI